MDTSHGTAGAQQVSVETGFRARRRRLAGRWRERGNALLETALTLPIMLLLVTGIATFGLAINQYSVLLNATQIAAEQIAVSRGVIADPCLAAYNTVNAAQQGLPMSTLQFSLWVAPPGSPPVYTSYLSAQSGAAVTCAPAAAVMQAGGSVKLMVTYPHYQMIVYGTNLDPGNPGGFNMSAQLGEVIQ